MTIASITTVIVSYLVQKRWTFSHASGETASAPLKFVAVYLVIYLLNWLILWALVDNLRWPHLWVQGFAIVLLAFASYGLQKHWVFPAHLTPER
jgi:putative flippase GtrA